MGNCPDTDADPGYLRTTSNDLSSLLLFFSDFVFFNFLYNWFDNLIPPFQPVRDKVKQMQGFQ